MPLASNTNFADPDAVFALLVEAHRDLSDADSAALNARLVLLLANHIGDRDVVAAAVDAARRTRGERRARTVGTG